MLDRDRMEATDVLKCPARARDPILEDRPLAIMAIEIARFAAFSGKDDSTMPTCRGPRAVVDRFEANAFHTLLNDTRRE